MEFRGRINRIFPVQSGTSARGTEWTKQDFVFEYFEHDTDRWSDKVLLSVMNDRIIELQEGDEVIVGFGHNIREYQGKVFNDIRCYKLEKVSKETKPSQAAKEQPAPATHETQPTTQVKDAADDLPF